MVCHCENEHQVTYCSQCFHCGLFNRNDSVLTLFSPLHFGLVLRAVMMTFTTGDLAPANNQLIIATQRFTGQDFCRPTDYFVVFQSMFVYPCVCVCVCVCVCQSVCVFVSVHVCTLGCLLCIIVWDSTQLAKVPIGKSLSQ